MSDTQEPKPADQAPQSFFPQLDDDEEKVSFGFGIPESESNSPFVQQEWYVSAPNQEPHGPFRIRDIGKRNDT